MKGEVGGVVVGGVFSRPHQASPWVGKVRILGGVDIFFILGGGAVVVAGG